MIDLIPYRSQAEVSEWLQKFPSLSYIIRDGAQSFRNAIFDAFPDVIQISDRFHVLKSLTDHAIKAVRKLIPHYIQDSVYSEQEESEQPLSEAQNQKQKLVSLVRNKKAQGWNLTQISRYFNLDTRTVKRYCDLSLNTINDHQLRENALDIDKYVPQLQELLLEHETLAPVYEALVKQGFSRTFHTFLVTYKRALE